MKGCTMGKSDTVIEDNEIFEALSKVSKLYENYLNYTDYLYDESFYSGLVDYNRDMSYPIGFTFKD